MKKTFTTFYAALMVSYVTLVILTALISNNRQIAKAPRLPAAVASIR